MEYNGLYDSGRNLFALGEIKWKPKGSTIKAYLIDPDLYIPDLNGHVSLSDIPKKAILNNIDRAPILTLLAPTNGVCDANDITFKDIKRGSKIGYLILALDNKNHSLICCINIGGKENYLIGSGRPISIGWSNTENKIFKL